MSSPKLPKRVMGPTSRALVCLMVFLAGVPAASSMPAPTSQAYAVSEAPAPTQMPSPAAIATIAAPIPQAECTPPLLGERPIAGPVAVATAPTASPGLAFGFTDASPAPTGAPTATFNPPPEADMADAPVLADSAASTAPQEAAPPAGPTPTYAYERDGLTIALTQHEAKNIVYYVADITLRDITQLRSAFSNDRFDGAHERVADIAERYSAVLAINGDFATFNSGGIILRNGTLHRNNRSTRHLLVIDREGNFTPYTEPPEDAVAASEAFVRDGVWQTCVFGPVLVENGQAVPLPESFFINTSGALEPRTAIAQLGPLHYMVMVVDGRKKGHSQGVSLERLQELLLQHGAQTAFNLDGGGSSTLYFDGKVVNKPGNGGQRQVSDILYFAP